MEISITGALVPATLVHISIFLHNFLSTFLFIAMMLIVEYLNNRKKEVNVKRVVALTIKKYPKNEYY